MVMMLVLVLVLALALVLGTKERIMFLSTYPSEYSAPFYSS